MFYLIIRMMHVQSIEGVKNDRLYVNCLSCPPLFPLFVPHHLFGSPEEHPIPLWEAPRELGVSPSLTRSYIDPSSLSPISSTPPPPSPPPPTTRRKWRTGFIKSLSWAAAGCGPWLQPFFTPIYCAYFTAY